MPKEPETEFMVWFISRKMPVNKLSAVIFSHGFGGNYQFGTQYAKAMAEKG